MEIIRNKKELIEFVADGSGDPSGAYDVDAHWEITDVDYDYPILLECMGTTHLGTAYKAYSQEDIQTIEKFKVLAAGESNEE